MRSVAREARARYNELTEGAIPGFKPEWRHNRLLKEMYNRGYRFERPARGDGLIFENPATGEEVRIMERPFRRKRTDADAKHLFDEYYRYKRPDGRWGEPVPVPGKNK